MTDRSHRARRHVERYFAAYVESRFKYSFRSLRRYLIKYDIVQRATPQFPSTPKIGHFTNWNVRTKENSWRGFHRRHEDRSNDPSSFVSSSNVPPSWNESFLFVHTFYTYSIFDHFNDDTELTRVWNKLDFVLINDIYFFNDNNTYVHNLRLQVHTWAYTCTSYINIDVSPRWTDDNL